MNKKNSIIIIIIKLASKVHLLECALYVLTVDPSDNEPEHNLGHEVPFPTATCIRSHCPLQL